MNNQKKNTKICVMIGLLCFGLSFNACVDYLNKAPEAIFTENDIFGNFNSFQGWVEEMYVCIPKQLSMWRSHDFTEVLCSSPVWFDDGNYWSQNDLYRDFIDVSPSSGEGGKGLWPNAWYAIRKANIGLKNIDLLEGTQEEKNLIKGQCLYFRAFFYFELMKWWGGLPYVLEPLSVSDVIALPRLNYKETALKAAEDFKAAAELLPLTWANTNTLVKENDGGTRITKFHALGYLGKNLLYAASPMMNETTTGNNAYDAELCKQAAEVFAEIIRLCEQDGSRYKLETWQNYSLIFNTISSGNTVRPGGTEAIQNQMVYETQYTRWTHTRLIAPGQWGSGGSYCEVPTHNHVQDYCMENGLPIDDPDSGYDPDHPWTGREPRFYHNVVCHDTRLVINAVSNDAKINEFAQLDNQGRHRHGTPAAGSIYGSVSGYFTKKFLPLGCNPYDNQWGIHNAWPPYLRLADIYLMYAEAVYHGYGSASSSYPGCAYTAQTAIERIRSRAQLNPLPDRYYSGVNFMETLIRERSVELCYEYIRLHDLRRWNIAGELKYRQKAAINFDLNSDGEPVNFRETVLVTRVFDKRHNWLPFQTSFTTIHEGFPQNPGW